MPKKRNAAEVESLETYYGLDPRHRASDKELHRILEGLKDRGSQLSKLVKTSLHLELGGYPRPARTISERRHCDIAASFLLSVSAINPTGNFDLQLHDAVPLRTHVPVFKYGWTSEKQSGVRTNIAAMLAARQRENQTSGMTRAEKGQTFELLTMLGLGHSGVAGVTALPSLERHDRNNALIDGKLCKWDVAAISDGRTIPAGEYRIQVKTSGYGRDAYHPDITMISGSLDLGLPTTDMDTIFDIARGFTRWRPDRHLPRDLAAVQNTMLERLCETGPVPLAS